MYRCTNKSTNKCTVVLISVLTKGSWMNQALKSFLLSNSNKRTNKCTSVLIRVLISVLIAGQTQAPAFGIGGPGSMEPPYKRKYEDW